MEQERSWRWFPILAAIIPVWIVVAILTTGYRPFAGLIGFAMANRATLLYKTQPDEAYPLALTALAYDPNSFDANFVAGRFLYFKQNDFSGGLPYFQKAVRIDPLECVSQFNLAYGYERTGNISQALHEYRRVEDICSQNLKVLQSVLGSYLRLKDYSAFLRVAHQVMLLTDNSQEKISLANFVDAQVQSNLQILSSTDSRALGFGRQASVVRDESGILHLFSIDEDIDSLVYSVSRDEGLSWSPQDFIYFGPGLDGAIAVDKQGVIHVAYGGFGRELFYTNSMDFSNKLVVANDADSRQIKVDENGNIHLIWNNTQEPATIYYAEIRNGHLTHPVAVAQDGAFASLAIDPTGRIYVFYNTSFTYPNPKGQIWMAEYETAAGGWMKPMQISNESGWAGATSAAIGAKNNVMLFYITGSDTGSTQLKAMVLENRGWSDPVAINSVGLRPYIPTSAPFGGRTAPSSQVLSDGTAVVVWRAEGLPEKSQIVLSALVDGSWVSSILIQDIGTCDYQCAPSFVLSQMPTGLGKSLSIIVSEPSSPKLYKVALHSDGTASVVP